jgi:hypothetical protein
MYNTRINIPRTLNLEPAYASFASTYSSRHAVWIAAATFTLYATGSQLPQQILRR